MNSDWAGLPMHLLDSILEKLVSLSDYLRFSVVCILWNCVAKDNRAKISSCHQLPMLLISTGKERTWNLYNVMENKVLNLQLTVPDKRFCGSSKGWLIVVDEDFVVTLINSFFRVKGQKKKEQSIIRLPLLNPPRFIDKPNLRHRWAKQCDQYVFKVTITADPILNADNCIVVVIYEDRCELAFIRLSKDITWTYFHTSIDKWWGSIYEVVHVEDKFYVLDGPGFYSILSSFDITVGSYSDKKLVAKEIERNGCSFKRYLVVLNEKELLMVHRDSEWDRKHHIWVTKGFKVFGLNLDKCEWVEKKTVGDVALFVGDNSSVYVLASNFSGCQPNCIYFNHDNNRASMRFEPNEVRDFGVYNMENESISQPYTTQAMELVKKTNRPPIWIVPTIVDVSN